jgi:SAM-dependent methyltransferase
MSQFSKATFDAAAYLAWRPTYGSARTSPFYQLAYAYHANRGGQWGQALDIGCGPGFIAQQLADRFERVTAIDPSAKMVAVGLQPEAADRPPIRYEVGSAEDLAMLATGSVDLITAGQAAHWFTYPAAWAELGRVLRPRGTAAFFGYGEYHLPAYPSVSPLITAFMRSSEGLGPYWQQPGRAIVEALLDPIPFPSPPAEIRTSDSWTDFPLAEPNLPQPDSMSASDGNGEWDPASFIRLKTVSGSGDKLAIRKTLDWLALAAYLRTSSALHKYEEAHPEETDVVGAYVRKLREAVEREAGHEVATVDVEWPAVVVLAGKA